jgi:hypothetical protein
MNKSEIQAITLMMLHIWSDRCNCDWYKESKGQCSRCYTLAAAANAMPQIHEAFMNRINKLETHK